MPRRRYTAVYRRFGNRWAISVPEIRAVYLRVTHLDQAESLVRTMIAGALHIPADFFDLQMQPAPEERRIARPAAGSCAP